MNEQRQNRRSVPGVLGGMGPAATLDFLQRLLDAVPAAADQDHVRVLVDHNPRVPDRHAAVRALARGEAEPVSAVLADMARGLAAAGADFLVMPCNTAHAFAPAIRAATPLPLLDIVEVVLSALPRSSPPPGPVGLLAARGCYESGLYQRALADRGYAVALWDDAALSEFMACLYRIKAGERDALLRERMAVLARTLEQQGAQVLLAACTEIPLVLSAAQCTVPLLDATALLAEATLARAAGDWPR